MRRLGLVLLSTLVPALAAFAADAPAGWLGVMLDDPQEARAEENATVQPGVRIRGIVADGPAEEARLRAQDRILALDGEAVTRSGELMARLRTLPAGTRVLLTVERNGREFETAARLGERPEGTSLRFRRGWIGVSTINLPQSLRVHFGGTEDAGVMVAAVEPASPAEAAGLRVGDLVVAVGGERIGSVGAMASLIAESGIDNPVEISVVRNGADLVVEPVVAPAPERREKVVPADDEAPRE
jgi:S1-C subfamily serine protease